MEHSQIPRNCLECEYAKTCKSWYGGTSCKHKEGMTND